MIFLRSFDSLQIIHFLRFVWLSQEAKRGVVCIFYLQAHKLPKDMLFHSQSLADQQEHEPESEDQSQARDLTNALVAGDTWSGVPAGKMPSAA